MHVYISWFFYTTSKKIFFPLTIHTYTLFRTITVYQQEKKKKRNLVIEKLKFGSFNTINQLESQHVNSKRRQKEDPPIPLPRYVNMNYKLEQNMAFQGMHDKSRVHEKAQIITVVKKSFTTNNNKKISKRFSNHYLQETYNIMESLIWNTNEYTNELYPFYGHITFQEIFKQKNEE